MFYLSLYELIINGFKRWKLLIFMTWYSSWYSWPSKAWSFVCCPLLTDSLPLSSPIPSILSKVHHLKTMLLLIQTIFFLRWESCKSASLLSKRHLKLKPNITKVFLKTIKKVPKDVSWGCGVRESILLFKACHMFVDVLCRADSPEAKLLLRPPLRAAGRNALEPDCIWSPALLFTSCVTSVSLSLKRKNDSVAV